MSGEAHARTREADTEADLTTVIDPPGEWFRQPPRRSQKGAAHTFLVVSLGAFLAVLTVVMAMAGWVIWTVFLGGHL